MQGRLESQNKATNASLGYCCLEISKDARFSGSSLKSYRERYRMPDLLEGDIRRQRNASYLGPSPDRLLLIIRCRRYACFAESLIDGGHNIDSEEVVTQCISLHSGSELISYGDRRQAYQVLCTSSLMRSEIEGSGGSTGP